MNTRTPLSRLLLGLLVIVVVAGSIVLATNAMRDRERDRAKANAECVIRGEPDCG